MSGSTISARWEAAGAEYAAAALLAGLKPATVNLRVRVLRAFAAELEVAPWELTREEYQARLAQLPLSPSRATLRGFYRWALRSGAIASNPTDELSRLPQEMPAPPVWEAALTAFEEGQRAAGLQESTTGLRVRLVRLFAVSSTIAPFRMTWDAYRNRLEAIDVAASTRATYRTALRAFYRWAVRTRRIAEDPTEEPSRRAQMQLASPEWEAELLGFQRHLRAAGRSEGTIRLWSGSVRRIARDLGGTHPFKVTTGEFLEVLASKGNWQSETRRSHVNALRVFYRWAKVAGRCKKNPAKALPTVSHSHKIVEPATEEAIVEALARGNADERLAVRLAAQLGLRRAEVACLHSTDLTGQDGAWWLLVHGKGNKERRLPIPDTLAHAIRARGAGFVFPGQVQGHVSPQSIGDRISDLLPPGVTMHKLRHRFATQVYAVDHDVFTLQGLLGHASPATTERYVRRDDTQGRRLVELAATT